MGFIEYQTSDGKVRKQECPDNIKTVKLSDLQITKIIKVIGLTTLEELFLSNNKIQKIEGLDNLTALQSLHLDHNEIHKIEGLDNLRYLQKLYLDDNQIQKIEGLDNMRSLEELYLANNQIQKIEGLDNLISLQWLDLDRNQIQKIEGLENQTLLQELHVGVNQIQKMEGLDNLTALVDLWLYNNQIQKIEGLENLTGLQQLGLNGNQIQEVEPMNNPNTLYALHMYGVDNIPLSVMNLRYLTDLGCDIRLNPIIVRFLNRNRIKSKKTIYDDKQNVHDTQINKSITESLYKLLDEKTTISDIKVTEEILTDAVLTKPVKEALMEYSKISDVHSTLNVTFIETLTCIWSIIRKHEQSDEIKKILNQEISDSICKCFTGRLSRLVNTLNGFDERVSVKISDSNEISNIIVTIGQKTSDVAEQRRLVTEELLLRDYKKEVIDEWVAYLE